MALTFSFLGGFFLSVRLTPQPLREAWSSRGAGRPTYTPRPSQAGSPEADAAGASRPGAPARHTHLCRWVPELHRGRAAPHGSQNTAVLHSHQTGPLVVGGVTSRKKVSLGGQTTLPPRQVLGGLPASGAAGPLLEGRWGGHLHAPLQSTQNTRHLSF